MECPCKGCPDRKVITVAGKPTTCHSTCPKYGKWRKELDRRNAIERKKKRYANL